MSSGARWNVGAWNVGAWGLAVGMAAVGLVRLSRTQRHPVLIGVAGIGMRLLVPAYPLTVGAVVKRKWWLAAAAAAGGSDGAWIASASPRRPSSTAARPRNEPNEPTSTARSPPPRASCSSRRSRVAAWWSISARRLTSQPTTLRSTLPGSVPGTWRTGRPCRAAAATSTANAAVISLRLRRRCHARPADTYTLRPGGAGFTGNASASQGVRQL